MTKKANTTPTATPTSEVTKPAPVRLDLGKALETLNGLIKDGLEGDELKEAFTNATGFELVESLPRKQQATTPKMAIAILVKTFKTDKGVPFSKAYISKKALDEASYLDRGITFNHNWLTFIPTASSNIKIPLKDGVYTLTAGTEAGLNYWLDTRDDQIEKQIVRYKEREDDKLTWVKELPQPKQKPAENTSETPNEGVKKV